MQYLLDGYNVIFSGDAVLSDHGAEALRTARRWLVDRLANFMRCTCAKVTIVFDGGEGGSWRPRREEDAGVEIVYSSARTSADEIIIAEIEKRRGSRRLVIVTDDGTIRRAARKARVAVAGCREFLREMRRACLEASENAEPPAKLQGISDQEVPWWRDYLNLKGENKE